MSLVADNKTYVSEGSRWYSTEGRSVEDIIGTNGNSRKPTLRDARKEGWIPSVTSILHIMAKPELDRWKMRECVKMAYKIPPGELETEEEYSDSVVEKAREEMSRARDIGSEVHGAIDRFLLTAQYVAGHSRHIKAAVAALDYLGIAGQRFMVETPFCRNGVAGKIDLMGHPDQIKPTEFIVDWKTSSKPLDDGKVPDWDDYCAQIAAYSVGYFGRFVPCHNVFLSTSIPGNYAVKTWTTEELKRGWDMYWFCRELWRIKNRYHFPTSSTSEIR